MKNISILGSTGSIGRQALEVISAFPDKFTVTGLAAGMNIEVFAEQINKFKPKLVSVKRKEDIKVLKNMIKEPYPEIFSSNEGLIKIAEHQDNSMVLIAVVGYIGLLPTIKAIEAGKDIAIANKETLVIGGALINNLLKTKNIKFLPVDSEHSAIFQCLQSSPGNKVRRIILTASGGPFRNLPVEKLKDITPQMALAHPTWKMGPKITIDCATMMNKGLEMIEAKWLFNIHTEQIKILIHPQSIIHSLVEFCDMSTIAQMSIPDMRLPIQYALTYPNRQPNNSFVPLELEDIGKLEFEKVDFNRFPCLGLAYDAIKEGGTMPAVMNGANEIAVSAFLNRKIPFNKISCVISHVMEKHSLMDIKLENILEATEWAFSKTKNILSKYQ